MNSSNAPIAPLSKDTEVFSTKTPPTETQVARAARFANWPVTVKLAKRVAEVKFEQVPDRPEFVFRFAAAIYFRSWDQKISIVLRHGANLADVQYMQSVVEELKAGYFDLYPMVKQRGASGRYWTLHLGRAVHADDLAGIREFPRLPSADLIAVHCDEPACQDFESVHFRDAEIDPWYLHVHEEITAEGWSITVERANDTAEWSIHTDIEKWALTPRDASSLANDLMWATATAAKLNAG